MVLSSVVEKDLQATTHLAEKSDVGKQQRENSQAQLQIARYECVHVGRLWPM